MLQLVRIFDELPEGFDDLVAEASGEGVRNMALLAEGWRAGARFQDDGEALLAAFLAGELAGVGALSVEPAAAGPARRLRRFYVRPAMRHRAGLCTDPRGLRQRGSADRECESFQRRRAVLGGARVRGGYARTVDTRDATRAAKYQFIVDILGSLAKLAA